MEKGTIKFESKTSELLECTCGNDVMTAGFDELNEVSCENPHYRCNQCQAYACIDSYLRIVNNIDEAQAGVQAVR